MSASYYRLLTAFAASVSLFLCACSVTKTAQPDAVAAQLPEPDKQQAYVGTEGTMDTESTIWNLIGLAKKPKPMPGPQTGPGVSPILWQAAQDTLNFAGIDSQDPMAGLIITKWYTPKGKTDERMRITAFIKSRALRSDSIVVTVERQTRGPTGWQDATIATDVANNLENDILEEARQIHIAQIRLENQ